MVVIANAAAGSLNTAEAREQLAVELRKASLDAPIVFFTSEREIGAAIEAHCKPEGDIVIAAGGDGTLNSVARSLVGTGTTLGILPLGTLNHFAKDLRIPLDIAGALRVIRDGITAQVDVGEVNGHPFLNNSSLGLYPEIVRQREKHQRRGFRKWTAFLLAVIATLRRLRRIPVRLELDGRTWKHLTPFVFVGNNLYELEGMRMGSRSRLDGGLLCVMVARPMGTLGLVRMTIQGFLGGLKHSSDLRMLVTREAWVETRRKVLPVAFDGEVRQLSTPLHYRIRSGQLRVRTPAADFDNSTGDAR